MTAIAGEVGYGEEEELELLTHFYVISLASLMESWLLGEIEGTPEELIRFADTLLQDQVRGAKDRLEQPEQRGEEP